MRDIVVVGGGPSGLYAAHLLAERGRDVLVLDRRPRIAQNVICTGIVGQEAFERFGLSRESILAPIQRLRLVSPRGTTLTYDHPQVLAYAVNRYRFDNEIRRRAERSSAEIQTNTVVNGVRVTRDCVELTVTTGDTTSVVRAALVIIAAGVSYRLQNQLGLGLPPHFLRAAQLHLALKAGDRVTVYVGQDVAPGGFAWLVPIGADVCRLGLMTEGNARELFDRLLDRLGLTACPKVDQVSYKPIAQGLVARAHADRVLAIGEAAGQVKTTTGGGIYYGLLGAEIAAEVAGHAWSRSDLSARALAAYDRNWKELIGREITFGYWARRLASTLTDQEIERLVDAVRSDGLFAFARTHARFDWHWGTIWYLLKLPIVRRLIASRTWARDTSRGWTLTPSAESSFLSAAADQEP